MTSDEETEQMCNVLFELSNEDRLGIIRLLQQKPLKLTQIARELGLAVQETSRQLVRLMKVNLVIKNNEGAYEISSQGMNYMRLLPGMQFLSKNGDYFKSHSLEKLPRSFMGRIGELQESKPLSGVMNTIANIGKIAQESEAFCWYMTDQPLFGEDSYQNGMKMLGRGVSIKAIEQIGYSPPEGILTKVSDNVRSVYNEYRKKGKITDLVLPQIDFILYMNENEVGFLGFPLKDYSFDYIGFTSKDESFVKWCKDLYNYYWNLAKPRDSYYIT